MNRAVVRTDNKKNSCIVRTQWLDRAVRETLSEVPVFFKLQLYRTYYCTLYRTFRTIPYSILPMLLFLLPSPTSALTTTYVDRGLSLDHLYDHTNTVRHMSRCTICLTVVLLLSVAFFPIHYTWLVYSTIYVRRWAPYRWFAWHRVLWSENYN